MTRIVPVVISIALLATVSARADDFRDKVAPILESKCVRCHGERSRQGGLALHSAEAVQKGGEKGAVIEPGKPDDSSLIKFISGSKPKMPKGGQPLAADDVNAFRRWVESGAAWPAGFVLKSPLPPKGEDPGDWTLTYMIGAGAVVAVGALFLLDRVRAKRKAT